MSATKCYCIECYSSDGSVDIATGLKPEVTKWVAGAGAYRHPYRFGFRGGEDGMAKPDSIVSSCWDGKSKGTHLLCKSCVTLLNKEFREEVSPWERV